MNNQNRMAKDNIYKLLEGTNYIKNADKLDEYRDTKNKMFGTVNWFELETMSLNQFLKLADKVTAESPGEYLISDLIRKLGRE
tara:strand:+ start:1812 stop:2060 length:249 start_codon:yes stop_codon:yes gene_type:complete